MALVLVAACSDGERDAIALTHGGSPSRGKALISAYGCGACHTIPHVAGAASVVGPDLHGMAKRAYIAGVLPNTPDNMIRWLTNPPAVDDKTAMPNLHIGDAEARDIAAYLYTLH
jgi:cytochrome c2